ncbi:hypothetical protein BKA58DRAFT_433004 [Alternaria rosae]|uniref:uncharacterized protein n=1 Tax=Alternaria rosae TaxID=1187941 RepID=UPI001E8DAE30|nr:uncharacterized protein BKA58DRAFT_433004 [Alternaria rosae]KAH6845888.1 hypothetical protein BKA58DRAFT_433004 [Alternaria rosae]
MAESEYGAALWVHDRIGARNSDAELTAPLLAAHYTAQDAPNVSTSSHPQLCPALPPIGMRHHYYAPHAHSYQFTNPQRPSQTWSGPPHLHPDQAFYDPSVISQGDQLRHHPGAPRHDFPLLGSPHAAPPSNPRHRHDYRRHDHRMSAGAVTGSIPTDITRFPEARDSVAPPEARFQHPRLPLQEAIHPGEPMYSGLPARQWTSHEVPNRRSDRSVSPRTSNRRNFDRYSVDLSHSSTSSDAEEAAARAPPLNRMRHRSREVRPRIAGRYPPQFDPNIATARQIDQLKNSLQRHLPSALPEKASKACDICQKDYAATHVSPTEEEEIAIELSCGHTFGEFCIGQWFETCRTHKNKVTCPMCRKQLIETPRFMPSMMQGQAFLDLLARQNMHVTDLYSHFPQA